MKKDFKYDILEFKDIRLLDSQLELILNALEILAFNQKLWFSDENNRIKEEKNRTDLIVNTYFQLNDIMTSNTSKQTQNSNIFDMKEYQLEINSKIKNII